MLLVPQVLLRTTEFADFAPHLSSSRATSSWRVVGRIWGAPIVAVCHRWRAGPPYERARVTLLRRASSIGSNAARGHGVGEAAGATARSSAGVSISPESGAPQPELRMCMLVAVVPEVGRVRFGGDGAALGSTERSVAVAVCMFAHASEESDDFQPYAGPQRCSDCRARSLKLHGPGSSSRHGS